MHMEGEWAVLTDPERDALAREIRRYGEMRGAVPYAETELRAELASDGTYDRRRIDDRIDEFRADHRVELDRAASIESDFAALANSVEQTGRVDMSDLQQSKRIGEVLADTGWSKSNAPQELRGVLDAFSIGGVSDAPLARARAARDRLAPATTRPAHVGVTEIGPTQAPQRRLSR